MSDLDYHEAASLILVAKRGGHRVGGGGDSLAENGDTDYRILMTKRSGSSSYLSSAYVFPGGHLEVSDFSPRWWSVFEQLGVTQEDLDALCGGLKREEAPKPPQILSSPLILNQAKEALKDAVDGSGRPLLPASVALRIAAIRETFEETSVLLLNHPPSKRTSENNRRSGATSARKGAATPGGQQQQSEQVAADAYLFDSIVQSKVDFKRWRNLVHRDPSRFSDLFLEMGLPPDLWSLKEWWNWLTPKSYGHKRFDTMFYICCLDCQPVALTDNKEVTTVEVKVNFHLLAPRAGSSSNSPAKMTSLTSHRIYVQINSHPNPDQFRICVLSVHAGAQYKCDDCIMMTIALG